MKLGILTFHSQLNYGGVLQAFALQEALRNMGHDVCIIDRWLTPNNFYLVGDSKEKKRCRRKSWKRLGLLSYSRRRERTVRFLQDALRLSPFHFFNWKEVSAADLSVDGLVVGSDQVWHGGDWGDPYPYLLEGAPNLPAISYAASFGMQKLPEDLVENYRAGFARFRAISCREAEGVKLVEQEGFTATHVVDPTLLLDREHWHDFAKVKSGRRLICYFLKENILDALPHLTEFAKKMKCTVHLYVDRFELPPPKKKTFKQWWRLNILRTFGRIKLELAAGPKEFVDAHASATWVLTDSFHSVMFSSIFDKNVRVIRPSTEVRKRMFARIEEFADTCVEGNIIADSLKDALTSFAQEDTVTFNHSAIADQRNHSRAWLERALEQLK